MQLFSVFGVLLGGFLTIGKELWFQFNRIRKGVQCPTIIVATQTDRFVGMCVDAVCDDGLYQGGRDQDGHRRTQTSTPVFKPEGLSVE